MRIDYNILWFENEDSWLKPTQRNIVSFLEDYGFRLQSTIQADNSNVESLIQQIRDNLLDVDVIFMDYRLAQETKGDAIIEAIRNTELFTEILFYSNQTDVKDVIEQGIGSVEGIYYAGRDTFLEKAKTVIRHTIKKVQDVNSMRGIIMATTSDIDAIMLEIVHAFYEKFPVDLHESVSKGIYEEVGRIVESKKKNYDKYFKNGRIDNVIKDNLLFDAHKKAVATQLIIDQLTDERIVGLKGKVFFDAYNNDVISVRNHFAHVVEVIEEGIRKLRSKSSEEVFTDERCIEIRKSLIKHLENIELVRSILQSIKKE